ncbi:ABC transporter ATP-binding protein [Desulfosarcina ovata]|uniref:Cobalamin/Fe3+-siderophore ABC transporter ATP-binding protein n=1 Tax=Desulfosarcina ovata subsp. ovata TaxID=2752305 RepID=A0A5K8AIF2_9BACT|nr:ABC transporter ATP-binding protein [Desulfosarcina ovata]BBO92441.1 cobalamin/Fe3+-siderophore ABC transporter ATP-binding protein [Desulfosarcina ovata subsp. ovata]
MRDKTANPILSCRNLTVGYKEKAVLSGLNLDFAAGQFISLLGPNGAGKTTLLRTLSRHLDPLAGQIEIEGRPLSGMRAMELAAVMAVVLTDKVSPPLFSVYEFVALGRYPHTDFLGRLGAADHQAVRHALAAVHADDLAARAFNDLSDGERQKALVARALAQQPRLLLLDEPTLHLDLKHRVEVMGILRNLCHSDGITVVASLHDVDVAAKVSDRVALIKSGAVVDWGIPETVLKSDAVAGLYDFDGADFDHHLGSIELRGNGQRGRVFVLAGMGSGALIYRMLSKRGFSIATGVLHTNDLDYYVARSLGAACISQEAMQVIGEPALAEADARLDGCDVVIDCGFQVGAMNQGNVNLLHTALEKGKPVLSLRQNGADGRLPSPAADRMVRCDDVAQLLEALDQCFPGMAGGRNPQPEILAAV